MTPIETNPVKRLYDEAGDRVAGMRAAINAKCANCVGCTAAQQGDGFKDHIEPGFVKTIRHCEVFGCPIWHLRPYQKKRG